MFPSYRRNQSVDLLCKSSYPHLPNSMLTYPLNATENDPY